MTEHQTKSPEASPQTISDLYQQSADYLETMLESGAVSVEPTHAPFQVKVGADVPAFNGKRLHLEYERANQDDDATQVDREIPLAYTDDEGRNHWQTPIRVTVFNEVDSSVAHDYVVEDAGGDNQQRVTDEKLQPNQSREEYGSITSLDANELIAHLEWALEQQGSEA